MAGEWKRQAMEGLTAVFSGKLTAQESAKRPRRMSRSCTPRSGSWWWSGIFGQGLRSMSLDQRHQIIKVEHPQL
jgi:hypothetical protein